jgi:hypothetical protein
MQQDATVAICFLNINEMGEMAHTSIQSALDATDCDIFIGTDIDVEVVGYIFPSNPRIHYVQLKISNDLSNTDNRLYQDFNSDLFYQIVLYKWQLIKRMLEMDFDYVIYSDTDVYWNRNPVSDLLLSFKRDESKEILIQDATLLAGEIRLCMGFVAIRNSDESVALISEANTLHIEMSGSRDRVGDDDVISEMYRETEVHKIVGRLPQISYPVGVFLNLYTSRDSFPGLRAPAPFIFHANFTIGLSRKYLLMRRFCSGRGPGRFSRYSVKMFAFLLYLRLRLVLGRFKRRVEGIGN